MTDFPHLSNPPIVEAVIEIKARFLAAADQRQFDEFRSLLADRFPSAKAIRHTSSKFQVGGDSPQALDVTQSIVGVRLDDAASQWVVQGRVDGLSVSRLPPYHSWEHLRDMYKVVWQAYRSAFAPEAVTRLGVRYINFIPLPRGKQVDLDTMFTAIPQAPPAMSQTLKEFTSRVVVALPDYAGSVTIQQALGEVETGPDAGTGGVILDVDAWTAESFGVDAPEMWAAMEAMHAAKNQAFFSSLQPSTWKHFL